MTITWHGSGLLAGLGGWCAAHGGAWRERFEGRMEAGEPLLELLEGLAREPGGAIDGADDEVRQGQLFDWLEFALGGELERVPEGGREAWFGRLEGLHGPLAERLRGRQPTRAIALQARRLELPPTEPPGYTRAERLGQGGMGTVYRATQRATGRPAAIKLMHRALDGEGFSARFESEVGALARLSHPAIAAVFDAGVVEDRGSRLPWIAMELVEGARPLERFVAESGLALDGRLALMAEICRAVQHGHERGVVHRDLKSDNVLVDAAGRPKLIDFGIARLLEPERGSPATGAPGSTAAEAGAGAGAEARTTATGDFVGTLESASPEQLTGGAGRVDERSDVYSLGRMLYGIAVGEPAFDFAGASLAQILDTLRTAMPAAPSRRVPGLPRELDHVVAKALERDPDRRYRRALDLAEDIDRVRERRPVLAAPPALANRLRLFLARHSLAAAVGLGALSVSVAALAGIAVRENLRGRELDALGEERRYETYVAQVVSAGQALRSGNLKLARQALDACDADLRQFEWDYLAERLRSPALPVVERTSWYRNVGFGGGRAFVASQDDERRHEVALFDADWTRIGGASLDLGYQLRFFELLDAGERLLGVGQDGDWMLGRWARAASETPEGELQLAEPEEFRLEGCGRVAAFCLERASGRAFVCDGGGNLGVWRIDGPRRLEPLSDLDESAVHLSAHVGSGGSWVAAISGNSRVSVVDADTSELVFDDDTRRTAAWSWRGLARFSPCGRWLAVLRPTAQVEILRTADWTRTSTFGEGIGRVEAAQWTRDGDELLIGGTDGSLLRLDADSGRITGRSALAGSELSELAVGADGRWLLAGMLKGTAKRVDLRELELDADLLPDTGKGWRQTWTPDSQALVSVSSLGRIAMWDLDRAAPRFSVRDGRADGGLLALDSGTLIQVHNDGALIELAALDGAELQRLESGRAASAELAQLGPERFVAAWTDGRVELRDATSMLELHAVQLDGARINAVAASRDGARVAVGLQDGGLVLLDGASLARVAEYHREPGSAVRGLAFGGSGGWLCSVHVGARPQLLSGRDLSGIAELPEMGTYTTGVGFHPTQDRLAIGDRQGTVHLFEVPSGRQLIGIEAGEGVIECVDFSPDGRRLAASSDIGVRLIHATDDSPRRRSLLLER